MLCYSESHLLFFFEMNSLSLNVVIFVLMSCFLFLGSSVLKLYNPSTKDILKKRSTTNSNNSDNIIIQSSSSSLFCGWSGGAKVLGKLPVRGVLLTWITVGQGPIVLAVNSSGGVWTFFLSSITSLFFLPLSGRRTDID